MKLPRVVGIAGTNGSGKDTLGELLALKANYHIVSLSDILRNELTRRGMPHTRENLSGLSNEIRGLEGDSAMSRRAIDSHKDEGPLCITSIRTPGEAEYIQSVGGKMVWIDADPAVRYKRITAASRGRVDDLVSFDEFLEQQQAEMSPSKKGGGLNILGVKERADIYIENNFSSVKAYRQHLISLFELAK